MRLPWASLDAAPGPGWRRSGDAMTTGLRYHRILMPNTQRAFIRAFAAVAERTASATAAG